MTNFRSKKQLKKSLSFLPFFAACLGLIFIACGVSGAAADSADKSYLINFSYNKGLLTVKEKSVIDGFAPDYNSQLKDGWGFELLSISGQPLERFMFVLPDTICGDSFGENSDANAGCIKMDDFDFPLSLPYHRDGKTANIYDSEGKIRLNVDLSDFIDLCGDTICQQGENFQNCPQDCPSGVKDGYCDGVKDGVCDSDCLSRSKDSDCALINLKKDDYSALALGVIVIVLLVGGAVFLKKYFNKKESDKFSTEQ